MQARFLDLLWLLLRSIWESLGGPKGPLYYGVGGGGGGLAGGGRRGLEMRARVTLLQQFILFVYFAN